MSNQVGECFGVILFFVFFVGGFVVFFSGVYCFFFLSGYRVNVGLVILKTNVFSSKRIF